MDSLEVVVSLDDEKAFDPDQWTFLGAVFRKYVFRFINWLRMFYSAPTTKVRTNNLFFALFPLSRQGLPITLCLFAFAL